MILAVKWMGLDFGECLMDGTMRRSHLLIGDTSKELGEPELVEQRCHKWRVAKERFGSLPTIVESHKAEVINYVFDGHPRAVLEAYLLVNGVAQPAETEPAIDDGGLLSLEWDIGSLDEGAYELMVQVVDELGLEGQSAPLPMNVVVEGLSPAEAPVEIAPTAAPEAENDPASEGLFENVNAIVIVAALLALFAAVAVLILAIVLVSLSNLFV